MVKTNGMSDFVSEGVPQIIDIDLAVETDLPARLRAEANIGLLNCDEVAPITIDRLAGLDRFVMARIAQAFCDRRLALIGTKT